MVERNSHCVFAGIYGRNLISVLIEVFERKQRSYIRAASVCQRRAEKFLRAVIGEVCLRPNSLQARFNYFVIFGAVGSNDIVFVARGQSRNACRIIACRNRVGVRYVKVYSEPVNGHDMCRGEVFPSVVCEVSAAPYYA